MNDRINVDGESVSSNDVREMRRQIKELGDRLRLVSDDIAAKDEQIERLRRDRDSYANSHFERQLDEARKEIQAMRESLIHACSLVEARHDNARQIWAIRETANRLDAPFSHERVEERYESLLDEQERRISKLKELVEQAARLLYTTPEQIAAGFDAAARVSWILRTAAEL